MEELYLKIIFALIYILCSVLAGAKQYNAPFSKIEDRGMATFLALMLGPLWICGAIIRQTFVETWK